LEQNQNCCLSFFDFRSSFEKSKPPFSFLKNVFTGGVLKSPFLRTWRYLGGIAVFLFLRHKSTIFNLSKKAFIRQRDILAMCMNCQYI